MQAALYIWFECYDFHFKIKKHCAHTISSPVFFLPLFMRITNYFKKMELVEIDGKMFLKKSPVYSGIANQKDAKIICDYHDPEGYPTTEFIFNLWRRNVANVLVRAPMDILELMFITYMHDFWVNTKCCQGKQYKVQILA